MTQIEQINTDIFCRRRPACR